MLQMICIDVDGTLVGTNNQVREDVWAELGRLRGEGVKLVLCSGRPAFGAARGYAERMQPDGWHVFQNGASVVRVSTGDSLSSAFPTDAETSLQQAAAESGLLLERYTDLAYATSQLDERAKRHAELLGVDNPPLFADFSEGQTVRMQWVVGHEEAARARELTPAGVDLHPAGSPRMTDTLFISLTRQGISKGSAIRQVAKEYGVALERTMMVGDGENDLQALAVVGHAVAMGNADEQVKRAAAYHVAHVDEGGLLEALALARTL